MRLADYPEREGKRVWLTIEEIDGLIDKTDTATEQVALTLGGKAGLRREEIVSVKGRDFRDAPKGFVRVWGDYAKRDKFREVPIPDDLAAFIRGLTQGRAADQPVILNTNTGNAYDGSSVYRWLKKAADRMGRATGDDAWQYVDVHDLRRSWGGHLLWNCGVSPMSVMDFGGWESWVTFQEHYMGEMTPQARDMERAKIDFLGGEPDPESQVLMPSTKAAKRTYGD